MKFAQKQLLTSEKNETVANGRLARLRPFQEEEIIREGGRLNHSDFPCYANHPKILPTKHPVSELIIRHHLYLNGLWKRIKF